MAVKKQKPEKKFVIERVRIFDEYRVLTKKQITDLIESAYENVPEEYRESVCFSVELEDSDPYSNNKTGFFVVQWKRHETDYEYKTRLDKEEQFRIRQEQNEREQFERLSKKFANG